ncbi:MAG TPA: potassium transporter Kup [Xanthobacteraceae bacterium]|nr:potassium transporter Kup [Xanthobacteraceae bacterium]
MPITGSGSSAVTADRSDALPRAGFWTLMIGSIGVVYGDIGTSPLYAIRESVNAASGHTGNFTPDMVLGVLSLIFWSLVIVVTIKYVFFLLYADNKGEGGTLSLMALVQRAVGRSSLPIMILGIAGAALFYGDAMLTPALSVLSAVEGLKIATPAFEPYIAPLAVVILFALFSVQYRGTAAVSALFGPITSVWFLALAAAGAYHISLNPSVLAALNPAHGLWFLLEHGAIGFITLGAVFLAVTGAEALYADLGHFGRKPIQIAWLAFVFPALVINYFGQGALLLATPTALENPFFLLYPEWALYPMVALATAATVIASQAVITGAYSITQQAVQLGLLPRLEVRHTSDKLFGQIYIPRVNWVLLIGVLLLVGLFRTSSSLATAYGIAVTGTMVITALLAFVVLWKVWRWNPIAAGLLIAPFLLIDLTFLSANLAKVWDGGWVSLVVAGLLMTVMATWRRGSRLLAEKTRRLEVPLDALVRNLELKPPHRVPGTAVFLTHDPQSTPTALLHSLKHYHVLHENNVVLTVETADQPRVAEEDRVAIERVGDSFARVTVRYGYMETPHVPKALAIARQLGWQFDIMATSFFLSRRSLRPAAKSSMPRWQDRLFLGLARQANDASAYFRIPSERAVEVGMQVAI